MQHYGQPGCWKRRRFLNPDESLRNCPVSGRCFACRKHFPKADRIPSIAALNLCPRNTPINFVSVPGTSAKARIPYVPPVRPPANFDWKLDQLKKLGFDAMMFHDDDAVTEIESEAQIRKEARELKKRLDDEGITAEMVAPRLWFAPKTIDDAYTSNQKQLMLAFAVRRRWNRDNEP